jgi:hypothetical protein
MTWQDFLDNPAQEGKKYNWRDKGVAFVENLGDTLPTTWKSVFGQRKDEKTRDLQLRGSLAKRNQEWAEFEEFLRQEALRETNKKPKYVTKKTILPNQFFGQFQRRSGQIWKRSRRLRTRQSWYRKRSSNKWY